MSPAAAAAMKAVLSELQAFAGCVLQDMAAKGIDITPPPARARPQSHELEAQMMPMAADRPQHNKQPMAPAAPPASTQRVQPAPAPPPPPASQQIVAHVAAAPAPAKPLSMANADAAVMANRALAELMKPDRGFQKWLSSKSSGALLNEWNEMLISSVATKEAFDACARRYFGPYQLPADMAGWLMGACVLAESLPLCFVFSDAQTAGFPLIYINNKFTDTTGYTKEDCYGRCAALGGGARSSGREPHGLRPCPNSSHWPAELITKCDR